MRLEFPHYEGVPGIEVPERNLLGEFSLPAMQPDDECVRAALEGPIGTPRLPEMARGKRRVLIVCDDVARPTPAWRLIPPVLDELSAAGVPEGGIEFMMALGTHRPMTEEEMRVKVGSRVYERFRVLNHAWDDPDALEYIGKTAQGVEVWINRKVAEADLVIGIGRIMPIEVCGFTGGGKILVPGCCGEITNSDMHWTRVDVPGAEIIGKRDNPVRESIDSLARLAGLDFIVNVVMDGAGRIFDCVAGDLVEAHREGCARARRYHEVTLPAHPDIVVADGYPFDIEFWQVNKALDAAGLVVRPGGAVIIVSPCREGLSRTHEAELLRHGYRGREHARELVAAGRIQHKVVAVHMMQVAEVMEKATVFLVTAGIPREHVEQVGLSYAATPQGALERAFEIAGADARVAVLRNAAEMLPRVG